LKTSVFAAVAVLSAAKIDALERVIRLAISNFFISF